MQLSLSGLLDSHLAPAPQEAKVAWLRGVTYAHRGLHGLNIPENSPAAFARAMERGLGIECDVQRSADGQAMVFHDWDLDRLTGETGPVLARTAAELAAIRLTDGADCIPSLKELLAHVAGRVPLLIEVKSRRKLNVVPLCRAVLAELEGYTGPHAVMSFDPRVSRWFAAHSPDTVRGLVMTEEKAKGVSGRIRRHLALWKAKPDFLAYDIRDLPSLFAAAQRQRGLPVTSWTVRTRALQERAAIYADAPIAEGLGVG